MASYRYNDHRSDSPAGVPLSQTQPQRQASRGPNVAIVTSTNVGVASLAYTEFGG